MQATVSSFRPAERAGTVLTDDGVELPFPPGAVDPQVRLLRPGQRVRVRLDPDGARVEALTLATFG